MSYEAKLMCGIILLTVPTIQFGGYFLLSVLSGKYDKAEFTPFQKSMFRAGHAHAGVLVLLSLICELLLDELALNTGIVWGLRSAFPLSAILVSGGFFAGAAGKGVTKPQKGIALLYGGVVILAVALVVSGIGLLI